MSDAAAIATVKTVREGLAPVITRAGLEVSAEQEKLLARIEKATGLANEARKAASAAANGGLERHHAAEVRHYLDQAEAAVEDPKVKLTLYPVEPPNLRHLAKVADAARQVAQSAHNRFDQSVDSGEMFAQIEERWNLADWRASADPLKLTLAEAERLEAESATTRTALLDLSLKLAGHEAENEAERTAHRRAQKEAGRPVSLEALRADWASR